MTPKKPYFGIKSKMMLYLHKQKLKFAQAMTQGMGCNHFLQSVRLRIALTGKPSFWRLPKKVSSTYIWRKQYYNSTTV